MPKWIAGKSFRTPDEIRAAGEEVMSEEEMAAYNAQFDAWERTRNRDAPGPVPGFGGKFSDDLAGTEYDPDAPGYPDHARRTFNPRETRDE
ncbi:hypothetical protein [Nocardia fusca]|uniref:hypothetical protein n=1 Tax=Nocardia fusca TaxID=941183 RepID=UPI0007A731FF|nr:hypothetical protein [Nocardia fusca]